MKLRGENAFSWSIFLFTIVFFSLFFLYPIAQTVKEAFFFEGQFTLSYIFEVFRYPSYVEGLRNALMLGICSTGLSLLIALPLAVIADRYQFPGKAILSSLILVPLILPPFVGAIGIKQILGLHGSLNMILIDLGLMDGAAPYDWLAHGRFWGVAILNALHLYPILYLNVTAALANLDPNLEEAAQNLGSTGWRRFRRVTLPLTMPGIFAGGTIVFIWSFTELGVPLIFDYTRVTSVQIFDGIKDLSGNPFPYALVVVMLLVTIVLYALSKWFFGRQHYSMMSSSSTARNVRTISWSRGLLYTGFFGFITFLAVLPHIGVILVAFSEDWYRSILPESLTLANFANAVGHDLTVPSISNSLKYSFFSTLLDLFLGISIAYVVVRTRLFGRQILDAMAMLPLAVPGLVMAFGYLAMTREGQPFAWLVPGGDPTLILVIAYAVRRLPYVVRSAAAGFQQTSVTLEEAAQNLGASPLKTMRKITIPLITANLIAGGLLAFAFAMLEVSDSLILAQKQEHYPITKAIYTLFGSLGDGQYLASALGVWAMAFLAVTIIGASVLIGKKLGALFRV